MDIFSPILNGFIVGVTLTFMFGPAFIVLLTTSIQRGFKAGVAFAFGVLLSDASVLMLAWYGLSQFLGEDPRKNVYFSIIGGIILLLYGAFTFYKSTFERSKNPENENDEISLDISKYEKPTATKFFDTLTNNQLSPSYVYILKGFFLNIMNPGVWFVWITAMVTFGSSHSGSFAHVALFFGSTLLTVFLFDVGKSFIAGKLKNILKNKFIYLLNQIIGIILVVFGIYLIINNFYDINNIIDTMSH